MHCSRSPGRVISQHALQVSRPTPRGGVEGSGLGGSQAHTEGGFSRPTPGGGDSPGAHPMIPTAAGGMHPTGMHSCSRGEMGRLSNFRSRSQVLHSEVKMRISSHVGNKVCYLAIHRA